MQARLRRSFFGLILCAGCASSPFDAGSEARIRRYQEDLFPLKAHVQAAKAEGVPWERTLAEIGAAAQRVLVGLGMPQ